METQTFTKILAFSNGEQHTYEWMNTGEFRETTDFDHIKRHYFMTHPQLNPTRIVPVGPELDWETPHGRGGRSRKTPA